MYKIMIADDEGIVIDSLKFIIDKEFKDNCVVEFAKTGRSVIELAEHFRPDIAFMDIQMPGINGIEAIREIKLSNSQTTFIIMSAYDKFDYAKEAINLGVMEYINKPIERTKIVEVLRRAMHLIDNEREKRSKELIIREKMETVVPIIENGLIYNIIFRTNFEEDVDNFKNLLGIKEDYGYMAVLVCGDKQEGNHMTNAVGASVRVQNSYREVREIVKEYFSCVMGCVMANKIALFIPSSNEKMQYNERIQMIEKSREAVRKLKKKLDVAFRLGIGSVCKIDQAMTSYNEALQALVDSTGSVAHVDDLPIRCEYGDENYPIETEKTLFEMTEKGDENAAIVAANKFFDWMEENYSNYIMDIQLKALEFVLWAEHLAYNSGGMTYHFRSREDYLPSLLELTELESIRRWFIDKIMVACRRVANKKEEQSSGVVSKALVYINKHFNKDISLDDVSREVDISPYYFSKLFKDETGQNFIEYLTNIRIDKAKHLLLHSDLSMKEICINVGYSDPNYFSRTFKKNVGITPTEFKEGVR